MSSFTKIGLRQQAEAHFKRTENQDALQSNAQQQLHMSKISMVITDWFTDVDGCQTRYTYRRADDSPKKKRLTTRQAALNKLHADDDK